MKPNISKRSISLSIFLVIILFLVTGVHAEEEKCVDVSGTWAGTEEIDNSDCGFPNQTITYTYELTKMSYRHIWVRGSGNLGSFPALNANFFTYQDHLVAVERNRLLESEESPWNIILAPGRIWSEPGDNGYSRASFPFTLIHTQSLYSQTHNGIATFLFNDKHESALRFQIVQEAAPREKFDAWGQAHMKYLPSPLPDRIALTQQFVDELAHQTPIHSWTELEQIYDPNALDIIDDTCNRENITLAH